jgi:hypothetical protein
MVQSAYASWGERRMNPMRKKITAKKECNYVTSKIVLPFPSPRPP